MQSETYTDGEKGITTTVVDDSVDDILDLEDSSPGEDDKIEEELNKTATTQSSFGSPSSVFTVPNPPQQPKSPFGSPSSQPWTPGNFGISSQPFGGSTTQPFGQPQSQSIWNSGSSGGSWWGSNNQNNNNNGSWWGANNTSTPFNSFNNSPSNGWSWGSSVNNQQVKVNINLLNKKVVFCSFVDTIICSLNSFNNGRLTYINTVPSNLSDLYVRKEVLFKMSRMPVDAMFVIVPSEIIRGLACNTSMNQKKPEDLERDMQGIIDYLRMFSMTYMKHSISDIRYCQFLLSPNIDWRYTTGIVNGEIENINKYTNNFYTKDKIVFLGTGGGSYGYSYNDKLAADAAGIDFLDTNILLNC